MTEAKTRPTDADIKKYLDRIEDLQQRADCEQLITLMQQITGHPPVLWGGRLIGFGSYHYQYASGRSGDWPELAFTPRKNDLSLHIMSGFDDQAALMSALGPHKTGRSCLYIKRLADVDLAALETLMCGSVEWVRKTYPANG